MYGTTTALAQISSTGVDIGLVVAAVVGLVFTGWVGLTAVGFLKRKLGHYVTGRKF